MRFNTNRIPTRWVLSTCLVLALLVVSSQGAEWTEVCKASIVNVGNAANYNGIPKDVVCMEGTEELTDESPCITEHGAKPASTTNCAFSELPVELFKSDPTCLDLFSSTDDVNTGLTTSRCLVLEGETSVAIENGPVTIGTFCDDDAYKKAFSTCVEMRFPAGSAPTCTAVDMTKAECIFLGTDAPFVAPTPCETLRDPYYADFVTQCKADGTYGHDYYCEYQGSDITQNTQTAQCVYTPTEGGVKANADQALCAEAEVTPTPTACTYNDIPTARFQPKADALCQYVVNSNDAVEGYETAYCVVSDGADSFNRLAAADAAGITECTTQALTPKDCITVTTTTAPTCTAMSMEGAACPVKESGVTLASTDAVCAKAISDEKAATKTTCEAAGTYANEYTCEFDGDYDDFQLKVRTPQCYYTVTDPASKTAAEASLCDAPDTTTKCSVSDIPKERFQPKADTLCPSVVNANDAVEGYETAYCVVSDGVDGFNRLAATNAAGITECTDNTLTPKECITVATTIAPTCTAMNMDGAACPVKESGSAPLASTDPVCAKAISDERVARAKWLNAAQVALTCTDTPAYVDTPTCVWSTTLNGWSEASGVEHICKFEDTVYDWEFCAADKDNLGTTAPATEPCVTADYAVFSDECADVFEKAAADNKVTYKADAFESACVVTGTDNVPHIVADTVCTGTPPTGKTIAACAPEFTAPTDLQNECTVVPELSTTDAACTVATYTLADGDGNNDLTACDAAATAYLNGLKTTCQAAGVYAFEYSCVYDDVVNARERSSQCYYTTTEPASHTAVDATFCSGLDVQTCTYADLPAALFVAKGNAACDILFATGGSNPDAEFCGIYTSETTYVPVAPSVADVAYCTDNTKKLSACTVTTVVPNEENKCAAAPTVSCIVSGTEGDSPVAVTGNACVLTPDLYAYSQTEFAGCEATELTWSGASCDGKFDADAGDIVDGATKTCMYGDVVAAAEFCKQNTDVNDDACTFADFTLEGARPAICAELYPAQAEGGKAATTDTKGLCAVKTTTGEYFITDLIGGPAQCQGLPASTLAECATLTFSSQADCTSANLDSAKCAVKDTEVEFANTSPCQAAIDDEALVRYSPNAECGTYAIQPADGACYFEVDGDTYTAKKQASYVCRLTGANENPSGNADLYFCLESTQWATYPDGIMSKDCSNDEAGLAAGTCDYTATIPHATCSVRLSDGTTPTLTGAQCKEFGVAACADVAVTFTGTEVQCSTAVDPAPVDATSTASCAIQLPTGALVPVPDEDTYGYADKCAEATAGHDGTISITPAKCVPYWSEADCDSGVPVVKCMLGNTEVADEVCAGIEKIGKVGAAVCTRSFEFYEWSAVQPVPCTCGTIPETTWNCVDTMALRKQLSPIDPYVIRFDYTDTRLQNLPSVSDNLCTQTKPTFNIPCACPTSTAVFVSGSGLDFSIDETDDYLKRSPNCGTNSCNIQTTFPTSESQVRRSAIRDSSNVLDQTNCASGYINGDGPTRRCQPSGTPYWTSANSLVSFAPVECSAACQVKDANNNELAVMHYKYVCVQDDHEETLGGVTKVLADSACADIAKPVVACNRHDCVASAQWVTGAWQLPASITSLSGYCKNDNGITFTRSVQCYRGGNVVDDAECQTTKPDATYTVINDDLPTCPATQSAKWYTTAWSACDATTGLASRSIYCGREADDRNVFVVADSVCPAAQKPTGTSRSCCLNSGTFDSETQKCTCALGFSGDYCELDNTVAVQVPDFQYPADLVTFVAGDFTSHEVVADLLTKNNDFVARISAAFEVTPGVNALSLPDGIAMNARYRIRLFKSNSVNAISNDFAVVPKLTCENDGTPNYPTGRCTCTGTFSGRLCETNLCDGCDSSCAVTNGVVRNCCSTGRRFSSSEGTCVDTCALQCSNGGFGISKPGDDPACQCACAGGWEGATCATCPLDCSANGQRDSTCSTCTCSRGYSTRVAALQCQCRSLVVRLSFRRNSALTDLALAAMKADIAGLLGVDANLVTIRPNNFNSRTGRQNVDIVIASTECATSAPVTESLSKPASWFKPADFADEFSGWTTSIQAALASPETLPSFVGYDATLGAAIEDPACDPTDVSANCMEKAVVGNGGPAITDDGTDSGSGSDDDDLKWIVPIAVLIPLAVIITGVILYVKCKPQAKATTYASSRTDGNTDVEMTVH